VSQIRVELQLEDKSFVTGVWRAGQSLRDFKAELARVNPHFRSLSQASQANIIAFRRQEETTKSLVERLRDVSIVAGGATLAFRALTGAGNGTIGNIVRINAEMEKLKYQLSGMSEASDPMRDASDRVRDLLQLAKETPFSLNELSNSFVKLTASGLNPTMRTMRALTDGLASFGASDQQLHRVTIALAQMQGKGVLSMEELRQQLGESMPNAMRLFARSMNVTVGQLSKMVSTGTVESTSAIQKFFGELERTYSGAGKFMMQSFSGLMSRIRTELTNLVTTGEMGEAFSVLKEKMGGLADFLGTQDASDFFDTIGRGLKSLMGLMDYLTDAIKSIREFFESWGKTILYAIGGIAIVKAISGFASGILAMKLGAEGVAAAWRKVRIDSMAAMASVAIGQKAQLSAIGAQAAALSASRLVSLPSGMVAVGAYGRGRVSPYTPQAPGAIQQAGQSAVLLGRAGTAMGALALAGSRFLGLLGPIGLGLAVLGPVAWEVGKGIYSWSKGADDAKKAIDTTVAAQEASLRASRASHRQWLIEQRDKASAANDSYFQKYGKENNSHVAAIGTFQKKIDDHDKQTGEMVSDLFAANINQSVSEAEERISVASRLLSRAYDRTMMVLDKQFGEDLQNAATPDSPESVRQVEERTRIKRNEERIKLRRALIAEYDKEIAKLRELAELGNVDPAVVNALFATRQELEKEMSTWNPDQYRMELVTGYEDDSKKEARLEKRVEAATERFKELQAEVNGASGEVAKLLYQINRGDFGNMKTSTEIMTQMRDRLVETTIAAEALDTVLKGINKTEAEGKRIIENQQRELLEIEARLAGVDTTSEADFYLWKLKNNKLDGMGDPDQVLRDAIARVTQNLNVASVMFGTLGKTAREDAFGPDTVKKIDDVGAAITNVKATAESLAQLFATPGAFSPQFQPLSGFTDAIAGAGYSNMPPMQGDGWLRYSNQNAIRNKPISEQLAKAMSFVGRMGLTMEVVSGGQDAKGTPGARRLGSERHDDGKAADVRFYNQNGRMLDWSNPTDQKTFALIVERAFKNGLTGFGVGADYMGRNTMHVGYGTPGIWGAENGSPADWLTEVYARLAGSGREPLIAAQTRVNDDAVVVETNEDVLRVKRVEDALRAAEREIAVVRAAQAAGSQDEKQGTYERRTRRQIFDKEFEGMDQKRIDALLADAIAADEEIKRVAERQKDAGKLTENQMKLEDERREIEAERMELLERAKDPNYRGQSSDLAALNRLGREQLEIAERLFGKDSAEYKLEEDRINAQRGRLASVEAAKALVDLADAARDAERDAITDERTARRMAFDERMAELAALRQQAIQDGMSVYEANVYYARAEAALRKRLREEDKTPLERQIESMSKYAKNINESTKDWAGELSKAIYDSFSDPDAFKNLGRSIRESIARSLSDAAAAAVLKPFEKLIGGDGTEGSGIGGMIEKMIGKLTGGNVFETISNGLGNMMKSFTGGMGSIIGKGGAGPKAKSVPIMHTGGIVGRAGGLRRSSSVMNFLGAPKYHTGGIIGDRPFRSGLNPSEVPIIAKRGEGVFTPAQMKHLGGSVTSQSISINAPISVNASGGTPEQNADLARQISDQTERAFRGIVQQELVRQMRPGGILR
jgi:tape measure domain-containing protein